MLVEAGAVAHVDEESTLYAKLLGKGDGIFYALMRLVGACPSQSVNDKGAHTL